LAEKEDAGKDDILQAIAEEICSDTGKWGGGNTEKGLSSQL